MPRWVFAGVGLLDGTISLLSDRIKDTLRRQVAGNLKVKLICFAEWVKRWRLFSI